MCAFTSLSLSPINIVSVLERGSAKRTFATVFYPYDHIALKTIPDCSGLMVSKHLTNRQTLASHTCGKRRSRCLLGASNRLSTNSCCRTGQAVPQQKSGPRSALQLLAINIYE